MFPDAQYMIILEEDLEVAVDIFSYFSQLLPLMDQDESLYCVSAWNDQVRISLHRYNFYCMSDNTKKAASDRGKTKVYKLALKFVFH